MIEILRALVDVGCDRPQDVHELSKLCLGGGLSGGGIIVTFLRLHELQLSAMRCVALIQIDPSYVICIRSFVVLCPHYSTLSSPLPFRRNNVSRKGRVFQSFVLIGFYRKDF